jgi:hypothetical protein
LALVAVDVAAVENGSLERLCGAIVITRSQAVRHNFSDIELVRSA